MRENGKASSIHTIQNSTIDLRLSIFNNEIFLVLQTSVPERVLLDAKINKRKAIEIIGIANSSPIQSLGITKAFLTCKNLILAHDFHVMHENVFLRPDGILGSVFLLKYRAKIDIAESTIQLRLPSRDPNDTNNDSKCISYSCISHSESNDYIQAVNEYLEYEKITVNQIKIHSLKNNKDFYGEVPNEYFEKFESIEPEKIEIQPNADIYVATITKPFDIKCNSDTEAPITDPVQRQKYIMSKIDLSNLSKKQIEKIGEICLEYSEAFYIPNDALKPTPVYKHSIKIKPNVDVVCVKQYRVPFAQREELERQVKKLGKVENYSKKHLTLQ